MTQTLGQTIDSLETQFAAEVHRLEKKKEQLKREIEAKQKELSTTETSLIHITREKTRSIKKALLEAGIEVAAIGQQAGSNGGGSPGGRLSSSQMQQARDAVMAVLPEPGKTFMAKAKIASRTGLDATVVHSALMSLRRDGQAQTNGARGLKAGWQRC